MQKLRSTLGLVELGKSLPHEYSSDNASDLASLKQHPGTHPELIGAPSPKPEQFQEMLVTLEKKETTRLLKRTSEQEEKGTIVGRELFTLFSLCVLFNYKSKAETPKPWLTGEAQAVISEIDMIERHRELEITRNQQLSTIHHELGAAVGNAKPYHEFLIKCER